MRAAYNPLRDGILKKPKKRSKQNKKSNYLNQILQPKTNRLMKNYTRLIKFFSYLEECFLWLKKCKIFTVPFLCSILLSIFFFSYYDWFPLTVSPKEIVLGYEPGEVIEFDINNRGHKTLYSIVLTITIEGSDLKSEELRFDILDEAEGSTLLFDNNEISYDTVIDFCKNEKHEEAIRMHIYKISSSSFRSYRLIMPGRKFENRTRLKFKIREYEKNPPRVSQSSNGVLMPVYKGYEGWINKGSLIAVGRNIAS